MREGWAAIGLSVSPVSSSPSTSSAPEPQIPERIGFVTTGSGRRAGLRRRVGEGDLGEHRLQLVLGVGRTSPCRAGRRTARAALGRRLVAQRAHADEEPSISHVFISMTAFRSGKAMLELLAVDRIDHAFGNLRGDSFGPSERGASLSGWSHISVSMRRAGSKPSLNVRTGPCACPHWIPPAVEVRIMELLPAPLVAPSLLSRDPLAHCSSHIATISGSSKPICGLAHAVL